MIRELKQAVIDAATLIGLVVIAVALIPLLIKLFARLWLPIVEVIYLTLFPDVARCLNHALSL